jgi:hypothetical protein
MAWEETVGLTLVEEGGVKVVEGQPDTLLVSGVDDVGRVLEECFSNGARATLLYAENLPAAFFDLSTGQAGAILQKFRNYGVRLAVVSRPGRTQTSRRFGEMVAEEHRARHFGMFESRDAAREWLGRS